MPRPYKLKVPYTTLNIVLPVTMKEHLSKQAHIMSKSLGREVSMAAIIRDTLEKRVSNKTYPFKQKEKKMLY